MSQPNRAPKAGDRIHRASDLFLEMAALISAEGIPVKPWHDPDLPHFSALGEDQQTDVLRDIGDRLDILKETKAQGHSLLDTPKLLWRALGRLKWTPQSDVFNYIHDGEIVEVYDLQQRQTFRNLQFFRYVSFTLEQVHTRPWFSLSARPPEAEAAIGEAAMKIITGQVQTTLGLENIPAHIAVELDSVDLLRFSIQMRCLSPVWQDGRLAAIIAVNSCKLV